MHPRRANQQWTIVCRYLHTKMDRIDITRPAQNAAILPTTFSNEVLTKDRYCILIQILLKWFLRVQLTITMVAHIFCPNCLELILKLWYSACGLNSLIVGVWIDSSSINLLHKFHNAPVPYCTMHYFATENMHICANFCHKMVQYGKFV